MKLRRETNIGFYFTGLEEFVLAVPDGFALTAKSIGDILNTWMQSASHMTKVGNRRWQPRICSNRSMLIFDIIPLGTATASTMHWIARFKEPTVYDI